jgi:hypothetical protein
MNDIDFDAIEASIKRHRKAVTTANEHNKPLVFDILAAAGITSLTVEFDGEGDSGQIESVIACAGEARIELPKTPVTLQDVSWNGDTVTDHTEPLPEANRDALLRLPGTGAWRLGEQRWGFRHVHVRCRKAHHRA